MVSDNNEDVLMLYGVSIRKGHQLTRLSHTSVTHVHSTNRLKLLAFNGLSPA